MKLIEFRGGHDAERLIAASGVAFPMQLVRPVVIEERVAPLVAARRRHMAIDIDLLDEAFARLSSASDAIVVEGVGGLLTPITESESPATLFKRWDMGIVIVARNTLGAANDVLLAVESALTHGLRVRAVVLNSLGTERPETPERTNQAVLKELMLNVPVLSFPHTPSPHDPERLAALVREISSLPTVARPV